MENPLSGGELGLAFVTGTVGFVLTDMLDRWLAAKELSGTPAVGTTAAAVPGTALATTGSFTAVRRLAALTKPGIWRILAQAGAAAVPLAGAYWVKQPMGRAALQGAGLGALIHLGSSLVTHFVIAKWAGGSAPAAGSMQASVAAGTLRSSRRTTPRTSRRRARPARSSTRAGTVAGSPRGLAQRPGAPRALGTPRATGVGNCAPCNAADPTSILNPPPSGGGQQPPVIQPPVIQPPVIQPVVVPPPNGGGNGTTGGIGLAGFAAAFAKASAMAAASQAAE